MAICAFCKESEVPKGRSKYCSAWCSKMAHSKMARNRSPKLWNAPRKCRICQGTFTPRQWNQSTCSPVCSEEWNRIRWKNKSSAKKRAPEKVDVGKGIPYRSHWRAATCRRNGVTCKHYDDCLWRTGGEDKFEPRPGCRNGSLYEPAPAKLEIGNSKDMFGRIVL